MEKQNKRFGDFVKRIGKAMLEAKKERPDIPEEDMLFSPVGNHGPTSIDELNDKGETMTFMCMRVETADLATVVKNSTKEVCDECQADVWMSPGTMGVYSQMKNRKIVCDVCIMPIIKKASEVEALTGESTHSELKEDSKNER